MSGEPIKDSTTDEREKKLRETEEWARGMANALAHQTRVADGARRRAERLRDAGQKLLDWYSAEHEAMPASWRVNHVLGLWSALKKACDEPIVSD